MRCVRSLERRVISRVHITPRAHTHRTSSSSALLSTSLRSYPRPATPETTFVSPPTPTFYPNNQNANLPPLLPTHPPHLPSYHNSISIMSLSRLYALLALVTTNLAQTITPTTILVSKWCITSPIPPTHSSVKTTTRPLDCSQAPSLLILRP